MTAAFAVPVSVPSQSGAAAATAAVAPPSAAARRLDAEKLEVYHVALELQAMTPLLVPARQRVLHDQLERASLSAVLCTAEGAGRHSRRDKRRLYAMARGSAMETAAAIDVVRLRRLAPDAVCDTARSLALRVIQMLSKLSDALA